MNKYLSYSIICLIILFASLPFVLVSIPPMTDLCHHVLVTHIINNYDANELRFYDYFEIEYSFKPTILSYILLSYLQILVGPFGGAKAYLVLFNISLYLSVWFFLERIKVKKPEIIALGSMIMAFSWPVYMGFLPFIMSFPLYIILMGMWLGENPSNKKIIYSSILQLVIYGFHIVGSAVSIFSTVYISTCRLYARQITWRGFLKEVISIAPVMYFIISFLGRGGPGYQVSYQGFLNTMKGMVTYTFASISEYNLWLNLIVVLFLFVLIIIERNRIEGKKVIIGLCVSLVLIGLIMPYSLGSLWPAGPRIYPYVFLLCMALINLKDQWGKIFLILMLIIVVLNGSLTIKRGIEINDDYKIFLSGMDKIKAGSRVLPIIVNPHQGGKYIEPFWSMGSAYNIFIGGTNPYVCAIPYVKTAASPLKYKNYGDYRYAFLYSKDIERKDYRGVADAYDYIILYGNSGAIDAVLSAEAEQIYKNGVLQIYEGGKSKSR